MKRLATLAVLGLLVVSSAAFAAEPSSIGAVDPGPEHADGTDQFMKSRETLRHLRNQERLAAQGGSPPPIQSFDSGDVAVIVDNGSILIPPKPATPFDLAVPSGLLFTPGVDAFTVSATATAVDPTFGTVINWALVGVTGNGDDDAALVSDVDADAFPGFPFLGTTYDTDEIFAGTDGHITFGASDTASSSRDAGRHIGGPPRISVFFNDLDPSCGGAVHADARADRVVITWDEVPPFQNTCNPTFATTTAQAVLHSDGTIDLVYNVVGQQFAVVGVAEGNDEGPINEVDYTADLPGTFGAGVIFEEFSPAIAVQQMDVIALAKEFYKTHDDKYDFLTMFAEDVVDIGGGFAFHLGLHSDTEGLGFFRTFGASTIFDSCSAVNLPAGCELESILNMNRIGLYWPAEEKLVNPPIRKFRFFCFNAGGQIVPCGATFGGPPGGDQISLRARWGGTLNGDFGAFGSYTLGLNSAMSIMGQEAGHRWLAFPAVVHPGVGLTNALLGRANAHWSFFHNVTVQSEKFEDLDGDPRSSSAEGNAIADLGPDPACTGLGSRLFQTQPNELVDGFTPLDEYFIGVRKPGDVPPFWFIDNPVVIAGGGPNASSSARDDVLICGDRVDRTLSDITVIGDVILPFLPSNGTRDPLIGDEQDAGPGITSTDDAKCTNDRECVDVKTMAFILLVDSGPASHAAAIDQVDGFRRTWEEYANGPSLAGLGARGEVGDANYIKKFDTSLDPAIH